jgi:hypothetical protein
VNLAHAVISLGDLARGFELQAKARTAAERFGVLDDLRHLRAERVFQDYWQGRWEAALAGADGFLAEVEAGSPHYSEGECRLVRGMIRLARGDLAGALADAAHAIEAARQQGDREAVLSALAFHARALLANGQIEPAGVSADELLAELAERGPMATNPDWSGPLAIVVQDLGRGAELVELAAMVAMPTSWWKAAAAVAAGLFDQAADTYAKIGSLPDEACARLRAAEQHLASGRRAEGDGQLQLALAFYRQVDASSYLRKADALGAQSA